MDPATPKTKIQIRTAPTGLPVWAERGGTESPVKFVTSWSCFLITGVFDNLAYRVDGGTVSLYGQVTRPTLKSDAESVVKDIEGVTRVDNQIEVLPLSSMDDGIRVAM